MRQADELIIDEIEITPRMIEAGRNAYSECDPLFFGGETDCIVSLIFEAMIIAGRYEDAHP